MIHRYLTVCQQNLEGSLPPQWDIARLHSRLQEDWENSIAKTCKDPTITETIPSGWERSVIKNYLKKSEGQSFLLQNHEIIRGRELRNTGAGIKTVDGGRAMSPTKMQLWE